MLLDPRLKLLAPNLVFFESGQPPIKLGKYFTTTEFEDRGVKYSMVNLELVKYLDALRDKLGVPINVTSGYRSHETQLDLARRGFETAKSVSTHEVGSAADINTGGKHTGLELEAAARSVGFTSVGVGKNWIHVDIRPGYYRWIYA